MKRLLRIFPASLFAGILVMSSGTSYAQYGLNDTILHEAVIYLGDTIESRTLSNIILYAAMNDEQRANQAKYNRLRNAVYVTYPYARRAGMVLNDINDKLYGINSELKRKSIIKSREKELRKEFTQPLVNLSVYQGKVLMKLINRETGNNCYDIIKEYKGGLTARLYQTVAFFFNSSLKQPYDARNEDATIEKLVQEVQRMYGYTEIKKPSIL
jgi:hypothetical protein